MKRVLVKRPLSALHMPAQQHAIALRLTFALMLFCFTSINAIRLVLSLFALDLGAKPIAVSLLYATFYLFPVALSWPIGSYSDRVGSRSLLMAGTASGAIGCLIPYLWRDLTALYVGALVVGLSFSFYLVLLQNAIGLLSRPDERARNFSNASMVGATTAFIGPLLAGVAIDHAGSAVACLLVAVFPAIGALLLARWGRSLPQGTRHTAPTDTPSSARPPIVRALVTSALVQLGQ
ncbi:MAG TPA: MFS transporter, partial [Burkholderiales bacterium]|nr:MFS transporter [Burkholderiales bacterium]